MLLGSSVYKQQPIIGGVIGQFIAMSVSLEAVDEQRGAAAEDDLVFARVILGVLARAGASAAGRPAGTGAPRSVA